jgi:hypothetical protein
MKPIYFDLDNGLSLIILPENKERDGTHTYTFQLYAGSLGSEDKRLNALNNYVGMISFDWANQEYYFTPGNQAISHSEILQLIACIKTKIY